MSVDPTDGQIHLQPWIIAVDDSPACWQLEDARIAVALFSDLQSAETYAQSTGVPTHQSLQPEPTELVRLLIQCLQSGIQLAALDPDMQSARRVFHLPEVLKKIREDLRAGRPLMF